MDTSNPFTAEIQIKPQISWLLITFVATTHIFTFVVILILPSIGFWLQYLVSIMILISVISFLYSHSGYRPEKKVSTVYWREFGGWEITTGAAQHLPVILSDTSFSSLYLSVLNFKTRRALGGQAFTVILLPDNCDFATRRYLRIRMKLLKFKQIKPSRRKGGSRWM